jgi:hypothetical protein
MNSVTNSIDSSQPLFPATSIIIQRTHKQSIHAVKDGGSEWAQSHEHPLTKSEPTTASAECPNCKQIEADAESLIGHNSLGWSSSYAIPG